MKQQFRNDADLFVRYYQSQWEDVLELAAKAIPYMDKTFGKYPYKQYSFIQGGDGGMEYPMATLLKGAGEEVTIHEWMHSWYQMMLGSNESLHGWMKALPVMQSQGYLNTLKAILLSFRTGTLILHTSILQKAGMMSP
jgi:hypothetical protein